jgi:hypothetical protein
MVTPPFDNLETVTRAIGMYKAGGTFEQLSNEFQVSPKRIRKLLVNHNIPIRKGGRIPKKEVITSKPKPTGKYDHLIFEPTNQGKNYEEYRH